LSGVDYDPYRLSFGFVLRRYFMSENNIIKKISFQKIPKERIRIE